MLVGGSTHTDHTEGAHIKLHRFENNNSNKLKATICQQMTRNRDYVYIIYTHILRGLENTFASPNISPNLLDIRQARSCFPANIQANMQSRHFNAQHIRYVGGKHQHKTSTGLLCGSLVTQSHRHQTTCGVWSEHIFAMSILVVINHHQSPDRYFGWPNEKRKIA